MSALRIRKQDFDAHQTRLRSLFAAALGRDAFSPLLRTTGLGMEVNPGAPDSWSVTSELGKNVPVLHFANCAGGKLGVSFLSVWRSDGGRHFIFDKAYLHFFWRFEEAAAAEDVQAFRLEWVAGSTVEETEEYIYQGQFAAHPHWHFDLGYRTELSEGLSEFFAAEENDGVKQVDLDTISDEELDRLTAPPIKTKDRDLSWLSSIHFPALANWESERWHEEGHLHPHQNSPASASHLEYWLCSALGYLRYEVEKKQMKI